MNAMCTFMYLFVVYFSFAPVISASIHRYVSYFDIQVLMMVTETETLTLTLRHNIFTYLDNVFSATFILSDLIHINFHIIYMYEEDLALNNIQWLICHKTPPTYFGKVRQNSGWFYWCLVKVINPTVQWDAKPAWYSPSLPLWLRSTASDWPCNPSKFSWTIWLLY